MSTTKRVVRKSETVYEHLCDLCGKKSRQQCHACERDCCKVCGMYNPDDWSDYPDFYCKPCWALPERKALYDARSAWYGEEDRLEKAWKSAALAAKVAHL